MDGKQLKGCQTWHNAGQPYNDHTIPFIICKDAVHLCDLFSLPPCSTFGAIVT